MSVKNNETGCVVAICRDCKGVVYAAVCKAHVIADQSEEMAKIVRSGDCTFEDWTVEKVRKSNFGCTCEDKTRGITNG